MVPICSLRDNPGEIRAALQKCGAIRLRNALDPVFVQRTFDQVFELFRFSNEQKLACLREGMSPGYTPPGIEGVRNLPKDEDRSFWDVLSPVDQTNRFPVEAEETGAQLGGMYLRLETLAKEFLEAVLPQFLELSAGGAHGLRCTHYTPQARDMIVMPSHVDIGFISIYVGGSLPGLQGGIVNDWHDVENPVGDVVIGVGTALRKYESSYLPFQHRVMGCGAERVSMAYFQEPRGDVVLPGGELARDRMKRILGVIRKTPV